MKLVLVSLFLILLVLLVLKQREKVRMANTEWLASLEPMTNRCQIYFPNKRRGFSSMLSAVTAK